MDLQSIRQRFGIIGNDARLSRALDIAAQVAATDISVLVTGESGSGKEHIPQVIHAMSARKHGAYIAVNCGAIPEGTIDSELFGHEKGSFTGANETRKGYFEVADHGTIFLDEVAELPLSTQVRLLRVLESKEFLKVGSSKVQKTDVRVVAATNVNLPQAISEGRFREDLFYRLNSVPIYIPPLRERGTDILLLFRKFAADFAEKYFMPVIRLADDAKEVLMTYRWPGNIRQLRNITEQISIIEENRDISGEILKKYLPDYQAVKLPMLFNSESQKDFSTERDLLYKVLFDMKRDMEQIKSDMQKLLSNGPHTSTTGDYNIATFEEYQNIVPLHKTVAPAPVQPPVGINTFDVDKSHDNINAHADVYDTEEIVDDNLSLSNSEYELIRKALAKHKGKRKAAAAELGIAERTLYRKLKEYNIN